MNFLSVRTVGIVLALGALCTTPEASAQTMQALQALQAFEKVRAVFQHPRCQNCHIPGDAPLQTDASVPHSMNVKRGVAGFGAVAMQCSNCHREQNLPESYGPHVPPGAPNWHLPPPDTKMVFIDLSPAALCTSIKDQKFTGGKDLQAMFVHLRDDKLVAWGWQPGLGRNPPPIPKHELVAAFKQWMDLGAPCPKA